MVLRGRGVPYWNPLLMYSSKCSNPSWSPVLDSKCDLYALLDPWWYGDLNSLAQLASLLWPAPLFTPASSTLLPPSACYWVPRIISHFSCCYAWSASSAPCLHSSSLHPVLRRTPGHLGLPLGCDSRSPVSHELIALPSEFSWRQSYTRAPIPMHYNFVCFKKLQEFRKIERVIWKGYVSLNQFCVCWLVFCTLVRSLKASILTPLWDLKI